MPRGMTDFNTGTRARYDYQYSGYQGSGARNVFAQLAQVFNSGTAAEQSAALQARHALLMGAVDNSNYLARHQGVSDIDFEDTQRRTEHSDQANKNLTDWYNERYPDLKPYVADRDSRGNAKVAKGVNVSLQQGPALQYLAGFSGSSNGTSGTSSTPAGGSAPTAGPSHPFMSPVQFAEHNKLVDLNQGKWSHLSPEAIKAKANQAPGLSEPTDEPKLPKPADTYAGREDAPEDPTPPTPPSGGSGPGKVSTVTAEDEDSGSETPKDK